MKCSKYDAKQNTVVIDSNYEIHCTESIADKENNKTHANLTEMIREKKLLILKHEDFNFKPWIDPLTSSLKLNCPKNNSYDVLDNVEERQKLHWGRACMQH